MADNRARVKLNGKKINLRQLSDEVGTALSSSETEVVVADSNSTVTQAELQAAVSAHVADTLVEPSVQDQFDALTDKLMSKGLISAAEVAQFKAKRPAKPRVG